MVNLCLIYLLSATLISLKLNVIQLISKKINRQNFDLQPKKTSQLLSFGCSCPGRPALTLIKYTSNISCITYSCQVTYQVYKAQTCTVNNNSWTLLIPLETPRVKSSVSCPGTIRHVARNPAETRKWTVNPGVCRLLPISLRHHGHPTVNKSGMTSASQNLPPTSMHLTYSTFP